MEESAIRRRLGELLSLQTISDQQASYQAFQGALTLLSAVHGPESPQVKDLEGVVAPGRGLRIAAFTRGVAAKGALESLRGDLDAGLVGSLRREMVGGVIADFLALAELALTEPGDGAKNVAAVLVAAAYEDTMRRMGSDLADVVGRPDLADVLEALKKCGVLRAAQFTIAQSYLSFRNKALHADWANVERASIMSVLGFVRELLLKHFS